MATAAKEKDEPNYLAGFEGSIAAEAWEATRAETDAHWRQTGESGFWNDMEYAANKVVETGTTRTKFEEKVKELNEQRKADADDLGPNAITGGANAAQGSTINLPPGAEHSESEDELADAKSDAVDTAEQGDNSGHVTDGDEAAAAAKEAETAPLK